MTLIKETQPKHQDISDDREPGCVKQDVSVVTE